MTVDQHELPSPDGASVVGRSRLQLTGRQKIFILGAIGAVALSIIFFSHLLGHGGAKVEKVADAPTVNKGIPFSAPQDAPVVQAPKPPLPLPMLAPAMPSLPAAMPRQTPSTAGNDAGLNSGIFSYSGGSGGDGPAMAGRGDETKVAGGEDDDLAKSLKHSDLGGAAKAKMLPHPMFTIPEGTEIQCNLQTAINSQLKGFVNCLLPSEVRGADENRSVILLDKGSTVFGQIRSGLRQGQDRLFILWTRARTPKNVTIAIDSPAADELGRAGVPGVVNEHFWKRFGAAILFSVISAAPSVASSALNNGNGSNNNYTSYLSPQQQLADTVLRSQIDIPPTLEKNQGDTVSIFVGRDLDFSDVYALSTRR